MGFENGMHTQRIDGGIMQPGVDGKRHIGLRFIPARSLMAITRASKLYGFILVLAIAASIAYGQTNYSIAVGPGTLSYQVTNESEGTCHIGSPGGQTGPITETLYSGFSFTASGVTQSWSADSVYLASPGGTYCPPSGWQSGDPLTLTGPTYVIVFNPVSGSATYTSNATTPAISIASSGSPSNNGTPVTFTATVTSGDTNTVTFLYGSSSLGTATPSGGKATLTTSSLPVGSDSITASIAAGGSYSAATSSAITQVVNQANPTTNTHVSLSLSPGPTVPYGATVRLTGSIVPSTSGANSATGTISFYDSGTLLGSAYLSGGQASISTSTLAAGSHSFTAVYSGDGNFSTSTAGTWPGTVTVAAAAATVLPPWGDITTVAGWGGGHDYNGNNIPAVSASLQASAVAADQYGNFYIADFWNSRVQKVTASTGIITTVAGNGNYGYNGDNILATSAALAWPTGVAVDANGNIYIADTNDDRIRVVYSAGAIPNVSNPTVGNIYTVAGDGAGGYTGDNVLATTTALNWPGGIAVDAGGNIYIADTSNNRTRVVYSSGTIPNVPNPTVGYIYTVAGTGSGGYNGDGLLANSAELNTPLAVAVDAGGNIYIADTYNNRSRVVYSSGAIPNTVNPTVGYIYTVAGTGQAGFNGDNQSGIVTELNGPYGIAVDGFGNIFIGDFNNQRVREVYSAGPIPNVSNPTAGYVYTIAGTGTAGYNGDNILASGAELNHPIGVALDGNGNLYIADDYNYRIRAVGGQLTAGTLAPLYKVFSILYSPPGNQSTQGYGSSTTNSTTTTVGTNFTQSYQVGFNSMPKDSPVGGGGTITYANTSGNSYAFTTTVTNAETMTSGDNNSTTFNPTSSDEDNHGLDVFEIWLNPLVTIEFNGTTAVSYSVSSNPITINGEQLPWADIVGVPAFTMEAWPAGVINAKLNPTGTGGVSTVPVDLLMPIPISQQYPPSAPPAYIPGLGAICANNTLYQQQLAADLANPASPVQFCTQANQCGCQPSDFAGILQENPLLNYNSATFTASPYPGWTSPLQANNSPISVCGLNTVPNTPSNPADCRYVVVPAPNTNTPATASDYAIPLSFFMEGGIQSPGYTYTDGTTSTETITGSTATTVGISFSVGIPAFTFKTQDQWTWTDTHSIGNSNTIANSMFVTAKSGTGSCDEYVSFFEDTQFHTFVFEVPPASQTGCN